MSRLEKFGKTRDLGIVSTEDARLLLIDPTADGFFANVLTYNVAKNEAVRKFIEAVREVQEANIDKFWIPIYDPSIEGEEVVFKAGNAPAVGYTFDFWVKTAKEMPTVDGKHWSVGSEYQYYAFLVWLINSKLKRCWNVYDAIKAVACDSKEVDCFGNKLYNFRETGSIGLFGVYDLANTFKLLSCTNEEYGGFWCTGEESYRCFPLASLVHIIDDYYNLDNHYSVHGHGRSDTDHISDNCVGWLVLS